MLTNVIIKLIFFWKFFTSCFFFLIFIDYVNFNFKLINWFFDVCFRFRLIFRIELVFWNYLQRLFERRQNNWSKFLFVETLILIEKRILIVELILIFLILINKIFKLIKDIIWKKLKLLKIKLTIVDDKLLRKTILSFSIWFINWTIAFININIVKKVTFFTCDD